MSNSDKNLKDDIQPDEEMLKNLDLLLNYDLIRSEDQWQLSEEIETLDDLNIETNENEVSKGDK